MKNIFQGWEYINALLTILKEEQEKNEGIIAPKYIYRGIRRTYLDNDQDLSKKISDRYFEEKPKDASNNKIDNVGLLQKLMNDSDYQKITPKYIRSGAAVRIQNLEERTQVDYLYYLNNMIDEVKRRYPNYKDMDDMEILAEIQHKGGASCLVDFSNNFLVSLWFATQDYSDEKNKNMGYLFCYDINTDLFVNNTVAYLRDIKGILIDELLFQTQKSIKYNGRDSYKFYVWKPSQMNERIARQDSIFLFGIEKFKIDEHPVIILPIPFAWKKSIQYTLKSLFGISAETLFADVTGYAISNDKFSPHKIGSSYFNIEKLKIESTVFDSFQRGVSCLINKEYALAIKYFCKFEALNYLRLREFSEGKDSDEQLFYIEHHYSKALCYQHLNNTTLALKSYERVFNFCLELQKKYGYSKESIKPYAKSSEEKEIYRNNKFYKILEDYMNLLFQEKLYDEAISILNNINPSKGSKMEILIQTALNEIYLLDSLSNIKKSTYKKIVLPQIITYDLLYCTLLNKFFEYSGNLLRNTCKCKNKIWKSKVESSMEKTIDEIRCHIENRNSKLFCLWYLGDVIEALNASKIDDSIKQLINNWIDKLIECQKHIKEAILIEQYE